MSLATLMPSAGWRCLLPAGNLLSQMPLQRRCLVKGGWLVLCFFGTVNSCLLPAGALGILQSLPSSAYCEAIACLALQVLRDSHFTKTCGHWQVVGVSTRVLTRSPVALCTVGGSLG